MTMTFLGFYDKAGLKEPKVGLHLLQLLLLAGSAGAGASEAVPQE